MTGEMAKSVIVTGAGHAGNMGAAIARRLAEAGYLVFAGDVAPLEAGQDLARSLGPNVRYIELDVTREDHWSAAVAAAEEAGGLYGLVNNAAVYKTGDLEHTPAEDFTLAMAVNQLGPFLGMKYTARVMKARRSGAIVNISSSSGLKGSPRAIAYCGTKWALRGLTKTAAMDLAAFNIRVNSVHPGATETAGMFTTFTEEQRAARQAKIPLGRAAAPAEIAGLVHYLLSPESSFVTGAEVAIDGGFVL